MRNAMVRVVVAVALVIVAIIVLACASGCFAHGEVICDDGDCGDHDGDESADGGTDELDLEPEPDPEPEPEPELPTDDGEDGIGIRTEPELERVCCREDNDRDGYGGDSIWYHVGEYCPVGSSTPCEGVQVDCDDSNRFTHPRAPEICDYLDNNCDGVVDEGCDGMS